jgi:hypothetical protein
MGQRLSVANWLGIGRRIGGALLGVSFAPLLLAALLPIASSRQRSFWIAMAIAAGAPVVIRFNLYLVHDYYLAAISPAVAALLGIGAVWLVDRMDNRRALALLTAGAIAVTTVSLQDYVRPTYEPASDGQDVLPMASELARFSRPEDLTLVLGRAWSPSVHYYARRRGLAIPPELLPTVEPASDVRPPDRFGPDGPDWWTPSWVDREAAQARAERGYPIMISTHPQSDPIWLADQWPWIGVLGQRTYVMGEHADQLRGAMLLGTDRLVESTVGDDLIEGPVTLVCSPEVHLDIPVGTRGTLLQLSPSGDRGARLSVVDGLAPILVKYNVFVSTAAAPSGSALHLSCAETSSIVIETVLDVATPATGLPTQ